MNLLAQISRAHFKTTIFIAVIAVIAVIAFFIQDNSNRYKYEAHLMMRGGLVDYGTLTSGKNLKIVEDKISIDNRFKFTKDLGAEVVGNCSINDDYGSIFKVLTITSAKSDSNLYLLTVKAKTSQVAVKCMEGIAEYLINSQIAIYQPSINPKKLSSVHVRLINNSNLMIIIGLLLLSAIFFSWYIFVQNKNASKFP
jgi:hypothetical protein